jgi:O-methyltransferase involved in polyketide biosynthesis
MPAADSRISPTAHYTAYVWVRNGLSPPSLASPLGRRLYRALWPAMTVYRRVLGHPDLETMLLDRHRCIDDRLEAAVTEGRVRQVIEIAAGFSGRGLRFRRRHPELVYIEGDLPPQAEEKRRLLEETRRLDGRPDDARHQVLPLDALIDDGPESLAKVAARLDPAQGCAILTEGLVGYFDRDTVISLWRRIAQVLRGFQHGVYLSDINLSDDSAGSLAVEGFRLALQAFARGRVHLHFATPEELEAALRQAGFGQVDLHWPGRHLVRVIESYT